MITSSFVATPFFLLRHRPLPEADRNLQSPAILKVPAAIGDDSRLLLPVYLAIDARPDYLVYLCRVDQGPFTSTAHQSLLHVRWRWSRSQTAKCPFEGHTHRPSLYDHSLSFIMTLLHPYAG